MSENSGINNRVIAVINFLAAHPTESFTLSELADTLGMSAGSAHRVLKTLTEARYLSRHPRHKTYSLGLALVAVGQATLEKHNYVEVAHREMEVLSKELSVQMVAVAVVEDEILTLARAGRPQSSETITRVGERRPFVPPFGLAHMAWASEVAVDSYLKLAPWEKGNKQYKSLVEALTVVRQRGYSIALVGPTLSNMRSTVSAYAESRDKNTLMKQIAELTAELTTQEIQLTALDNDQHYAVGHISAPVFNSTGDVVMEIAITGGRDLLAASEVLRYAQRLSAVSTFVTTETHGRLPA